MRIAFLENARQKILILPMRNRYFKAGVVWLCAIEYDESSRRAKVLIFQFGLLFALFGSKAKQSATIFNIFLKSKSQKSTKVCENKKQSKAQIKAKQIALPKGENVLFQVRALHFTLNSG